MAKNERFIPISITKAKVVNVMLSFNNDKLEFRAEVGLIDVGGKVLTSIYVGTDNYYEEKNAMLSLTGIALARDLRDEVEAAVIKQLNKMQKIIEHKKGGK